MNTTREIERRYISGDIEVRQYNGDQVRIEGYAARFNSMSSDLGGFVESIADTAFNKTVKEADVRALINHDPNQVLARNKAGTLDLSVDSDGLHYRIQPPDTTYSRDLMVSMERGDISNSSFAFRAISDKWGLTDDDYPHRTLNEVGLIDVSVVTYPAYPEASSGIARSAMANIAKRAGLDPDAVTVESLREYLANEKREGEAANETQTTEEHGPEVTHFHPSETITISEPNRSEPDPEVSEADEPETEDTTPNIWVMREKLLRALEADLDTPLL